MRPHLALLVSGSILVAAGAGLSLNLVDQALSRPYDVVHVPSGAVVRIAALGHRTFLSDLYWLRTVQYIGEPYADQRGWEKLYPLVDLVTELDPRHGYAYQTVGIVLSAANRLEESNRILAKGMARGPDWWSFPYYLAFNYWFYMGDYAAGAYYADIAARRPGASPNISHLAVSLASKSGTPEQAIALLTELRANVKDEATAARLEEQLKLAMLEADAQSLERAVARFREAQGRDPFSLEELLLTGTIPFIPTDPFGGQYTWKPEERKVRSSANPFRFELREGPRTPKFEYTPSRKDLERMPR